VRRSIEAMFPPVDQSRPGFATALRTVARFSLIGDIAGALCDEDWYCHTNATLEKAWIQTLQQEGFVLFADKRNEKKTWLLFPGASSEQLAKFKKHEDLVLLDSVAPKAATTNSNEAPVADKVATTATVGGGESQSQKDGVTSTEEAD
jgi:hypothetical protein